MWLRVWWCRGGGGAGEGQRGEDGNRLGFFEDDLRQLLCGHVRLECGTVRG